MGENRGCNLFRNTKSGRFYIRASISRHGKGREVWKSLRTEVLSLARLRLRDEQAFIEHKRQQSSVLDGDHVTFGAEDSGGGVVIKMGNYSGSPTMGLPLTEQWHAPPWGRITKSPV